MSLLRLTGRWHALFCNKEFPIWEKKCMDAMPCRKCFAVGRRNDSMWPSRSLTREGFATAPAPADGATGRAQQARLAHVPAKLLIDGDPPGARPRPCVRACDADASLTTDACNRACIA
jgi:hypothetical protein